MKILITLFLQRTKHPMSGLLKYIGHREDIVAEKQGGKVLVITDGEKEEISGTLSFKGEKIEVHFFQQSPRCNKRLSG